MIALALDVHIRESTGNKKSLDDVMRSMYEEFGKTRQAYVYEDIVRITAKVAGHDMGDFFSDYVQGNQSIDVAPSFAAMGLRLDAMQDEFYLTENKAPTAQQRQIRISMLGR